MSGFNGTGPLGRGPMTGKGRGYCINQVGEGTFREAGWGRGARRGWRNCRYTAEKTFRGRQAPAYASSPGVEIPDGGREELDLLRERVKNLEAALELKDGPNICDH